MRNTPHCEQHAPERRLEREVSPQEGSVANFVQNVMKGQLPLSVRRLRGESVELFGRSEALVSGLHHHLFFLDHVHEFDPN